MWIVLQAVKECAMDKEKFRKKTVVALTVLVVVILTLIVFYDGAKAGGNEFGLDNFYVGNFGEEVDPRGVYNSIYKSGMLASKQCREEMMAAEGYVLENGETVHPEMSGRCIWIAPTHVDSLDDVFNNCISESCIRPYRNGDVIISPGYLTFINSNVRQEDTDSICIEVKYGTDYVIRWDNVTAWWCHIGKDDAQKHTKVIGAAGMYSKCIGGYVIGEANEGTLVTLYRIAEDGSLNEESFESLFGNF